MAETPANSQEEFDWTSVAPGDEHHQLALEAYYDGRSFPEIVVLLQARGLSPELIPDVTTALAKDRAFHLISAGKRPAEVIEALTQRGLAPADAKIIAQAVDRSKDKALASFGMGKWQTRSLIAGGVLLTIGILLYGLKRIGYVDIPSELVTGLLGGGVLLGGLGGVYIAFGVR